MIYNVRDSDHDIKRNTFKNNQLRGKIQVLEQDLEKKNK